MVRIAFCENCCDDVEYELRDEIVTVDLKDVKFSYGAIVPYCSKCSSELSIPEINDLNIIRAYKAQKETLEKGK